MAPRLSERVCGGEVFVGIWLFESDLVGDCGEIREDEWCVLFMLEY